MESFSPPTIFILLSFFFFIIITSTADLCHPDDEAGLLAFKAGITSDPSGMLSSWKHGTTCCTWNGIECTYSRITSFELIGNSSSSLSGTISPSLSKLQALEQLLIISHPNITGYFPTFISNLPNLIYIYLEDNGLSGPIPSNHHQNVPTPSFWIRRKQVFRSYSEFNRLFNELDSFKIRWKSVDRHHS